MTVRTTTVGDTLPSVARFDRLREFVDRLHPSGLLYATYEHRLIAELDHDRLPRHVAVLADGNRRWARTNAPGQPLSAGYQAGADKLEEFVELGDRVLVLTRQSGRGKHSGVLLDRELGDLFTFRDGKIVRLESYWNRDEAVRAAGLEPP